MPAFQCLLQRRRMACKLFKLGWYPYSYALKRLRREADLASTFQY